MKLLTHNLLVSNVKGVGEKGYPLSIRATLVESADAEFDAAFVESLLVSKRVDYEVLALAFNQLSSDTKLPKTLPSELGEEFLMAAHRALFETVVMEGTLMCPESKRVFPIEGGIPNMLLREHEI